MTDCYCTLLKVTRHTFVLSVIMSVYAGTEVCRLVEGLLLS